MNRFSMRDATAQIRASFNSRRLKALVLLTLVLCQSTQLQADIFRRFGGGVIPGTEGVRLERGAQIQNLDLTFAALSGADLRDANLAGTNLAYADLSGTRINNADLTDTILTGVEFDFATMGLHKSQLYASRSYKDGQLNDMQFFGVDVRGWDFTGQNLRGTLFNQVLIANSSFNDAMIAGARFEGDFGQSISFEQLSSTKSYLDRDLSSLSLYSVDVRDWDLTGQNLANAQLRFLSAFSTVELSDANIYGVDFRDSDLTEEQLYSTQSYRDQDLGAVRMQVQQGWDLSGQNLANARLLDSQLSSVDFRGADLKSVDFSATVGLDSAIFDSETTYNQWTAFPEGFDPIAKGLTRIPSPVGDVDVNDVIDATDFDLIALDLRNRGNLPLGAADVNGDGVANQDDLDTWVHDVANTTYGDANLDGQFDEADLVFAFSAGSYEDFIPQNAGWSGGDWTGDGEFDSTDLILAFQDGGYGNGPRSATVPEPNSQLLLLLAVPFLRLRSHTNHSRWFARRIC